MGKGGLVSYDPDEWGGFAILFQGEGSVYRCV